MIGLVNKAIEDLALSVGGQQAWDEITRRAGAAGISFIGMDTYDDDLTYRLVGAASEVLSMPAEKVLEAFGEHWVRYTGREGYGPLLTATGSSLGEFLRNLDALHARVALIMPGLQPPSFEIEEFGPDSFRVHYRSPRTGLGPMVTGLLAGVGDLLGRPVTVERVERVEDGAAHDVFTVVAE